MMRGILVYALVLGLLALATPAIAQKTRDVVGTYNVHGTNPNGSSYTGTVVISMQGSHYKFSWLIDNGDTFKGLGTRKGDRIVVNWGAKYPVIYEVGADGVLNGTWENGHASETLIPAR